MAERSREHALAREVEDAREHVKQAQLAHRRGASPDVVNAADKRLTQAHEAWQTHRAGRVPEHPDR